MKIFLENVNIQDSGGPNSFAQKLVPKLVNQGCAFTLPGDSDVSLCFIESRDHDSKKPRVQRLDGIYFNTDQDYNAQNANIKRTYQGSQGVIFQSEFSKKLVTKHFGNFENSTVIYNGADLETINQCAPMNKGKYDNIWSCAASWRPHKRLKDNINYFLEHKGDNDLLVVAGDVQEEDKVKDNSIAYFGKLNQNQLYSLYKSTSFFLHLGWCDNCPNVVVDARACGSHIICSSVGGGIEIAGQNSTIIEEDWDFEPHRLYDPPKMDFSKKVKNKTNSYYDMNIVASLYKQFMEKTIASCS
jgi:glycosyltransferase involved in cell wall biosynthesis